MQGDREVVSDRFGPVDAVKIVKKDQHGDRGDQQYRDIRGPYPTPRSRVHQSDGNPEKQKIERSGNAHAAGKRKPRLFRSLHKQQLIDAQVPTGEMFRKRENADGGDDRSAYLAEDRKSVV